MRSFLHRLFRPLRQLRAAFGMMKFYLLCAAVVALAATVVVAFTKGEWLIMFGGAAVLCTVFAIGGAS